jgi:hypothetical protein
MQGVLATFGEGEVAIRAVEAGADVLLFAKPETMHPALKAAVESGRLSTARIDQSVRKILDAKWRMGLAKEKLVDVARINTVVGSRAHREKAQEIMDARSLVRNEKNVIPLAPSKDLRVLQINVLDNTTRWLHNRVPGAVFAAEVQKRFPNAMLIQIDERSSPQEIELARNAARHADAIIAARTCSRWAGNVELRSSRSRSSTICQAQPFIPPTRVPPAVSARRRKSEGKAIVGGAIRASGDAVGPAGRMGRIGRMVSCLFVHSSIICVWSFRRPPCRNDHRDKRGADDVPSRSRRPATSVVEAGLVSAPRCAPDGAAPPRDSFRRHAAIASGSRPPASGDALTRGVRQRVMPASAERERAEDRRLS